MSDAKLFIKFNSVEEVKKFVNANSVSSCNVDVGTNSVLIDGSSIVGMLALDMNQRIPVTIYGNNIGIEKLIDEYENMNLDIRVKTLFNPVKIA